ncbi:hypothetical protein LINPERHAP2_LOCUS14229, partial [Linum perenne]
ALQDTPPPHTHDFVIHCDGSFLNDSQPAAFSVVMTNIFGDISGVSNGFVSCSSPLVAEAHALKEAVSLAMSCACISRIFSDCKILTRALDGSSPSWPWEQAALFGSLKTFLTTNPRLSIFFTPRTNSKMADCVTTSTRNLPITLTSSRIMFEEVAALYPFS